LNGTPTGYSGTILVGTDTVYVVDGLITAVSGVV